MRPRSHVTVRHNLLSGAWTAEVDALEAAVRRFDADGPVTNDCQIVFFEIARDPQLHVNVTHRHPTKNVRGWAGPARLPDGFIHNRRFEEAPLDQIVRSIRKMVDAERIRTIHVKEAK
jgi:hypothetical protein